MALPGTLAADIDPVAKDAVRALFTAKQGRASKRMVELRETLTGLDLKPAPGGAADAYDEL